MCRAGWCVNPLHKFVSKTLMHINPVCRTHSWENISQECFGRNIFLRTYCPTKLHYALQTTQYKIGLQDKSNFYCYRDMSFSNKHIISAPVDRSNYLIHAAAKRHHYRYKPASLRWAWTCSPLWYLRQTHTLTPAHVAQISALTEIKFKTAVKWKTQPPA